MNTHFLSSIVLSKHRNLMRGMICVFGILLLLLLPGCHLKGVKLTGSGNVACPRMAWNGSEFGIVYYDRPAPGTGLEIRGITVNMKGKVTHGPKTLVKLTGYPSLDNLSELVWNPDLKQFAFAYAHNQAQYLVCLKPNMDIIGTKANTYSRPIVTEPPSDLSLVYNTKLQEYGLTAFVTINAQRSIHFSAFKGYTTHPPHWLRGRSLADCHTYSKKTSLAFNPKTGQYAVAFIDNAIPKVGFFKSLGTGQIKKHPLSTTTVPYSVAIKIAFDPASGNYAVAKVTANNLEYKIVDPSNPGTGKWLHQGGNHGYQFTFTKYWHSDHVYMLCTSQKLQIRCWAVNDKGPIKPDIIGISPMSSNFADQPCAVPVGLTIGVVWIENEALRFGKPELKKDE